jgi:hypothetical protein
MSDEGEKWSRAFSVFEYKEEGNWQPPGAIVSTRRRTLANFMFIFGFLLGFSLSLSLHG